MHECTFLSNEFIVKKRTSFHRSPQTAILIVTLTCGCFGQGIVVAQPPSSLSPVSPPPGSNHSVADETAEFQASSTPLFNGQSLEGWEGKEEWFRVDHGAIVAGSLKHDIQHNQFLCTTKTYADFELRLEVKLLGEGKNAGVQFRSKRIPDSSEISGFQADAGAVGSRIVWGALYDESRRRKMLAEGDSDRLTQLVKPDDWNELRIVAQGNHIQIYLNGERTIDYTEKDSSIETHGVIGLQIHSGPPSEAWYRNLYLRELPTAQ